MVVNTVIPAYARNRLNDEVEVVLNQPLEVRDEPTGNRPLDALQLGNYHFDFGGRGHRISPSGQQGKSGVDGAARSSGTKTFSIFMLLSFT
jgi:hypothetical protein